MKKKKAKPIPKFKSIAEERDFWDTHDSTDYFRDAEVIEREYSKEDLAEIAIVQAVRAVQVAMGDAESKAAGRLRMAIRRTVRKCLRVPSKAGTRAKKAA